MGLIYSGEHDGYITSTSSGFSTARDAFVGTLANSTATNYTWAVRASKSSRGGTTTFFVHRSFFYFDTSAIHDLPESATINFRGSGAGASDVRVVKSLQNTSSALTTSAFTNSIDGWVNLQSDGAGRGDNEDNVRLYDTATTTTWSTTGYNTIAMSGEALSDMVGHNELKCCLLDYTYDLKDIEPSSVLNYSGLRYQNYSSTGSDPYIEYVAGEPNKALFFGANF